MKRELKLKEGEIICSKCNGTGHDEKDIFVCNKCLGEGKLDWISNAVPNTVKLRSSHLIQIRQAIKSLQDISETCFPNIESACQISKEYLDTLCSNRVISEYKVELDPFLKDRYSVYLAPARTVEYIKMDFAFSKREEL